MAFHEESSPTAQHASPLMDLEGASLLALILQFVGGIVSIMYALPGVIASVFLLGLMVAIGVTGWLYMIAWLGLSVLCWIQFYYGYRMYKRTPGSAKMALNVDVLVCLLYGVDVVVSAAEGILLIFPEVLIYLAINVIAVILLVMPSVKETFESVQSTYGSEYSGSGD